MQRNYYLIRKQYLRESNYRLLVANSRSLNTKLNSVCNFFQGFYTFLKNLNQQISQAAKLIPQNSQYLFVKQLKLFMNDFAQNTNQIASFQIQCLEQIKQNNQPQFQVLQNLLTKVKECSSQHQLMQQRKNQLANIFVDIKTKYAILKRKMLKPTFFYDKELMAQEGGLLNEKVRKGEQLIADIVKNKENIAEKAKEFQTGVSTFKKKLVKNKYQVHRKIFQVLQNAKISLIELNSILFECIRSHKDRYMVICKNKNDDITHLKEMMKKGSQSLGPQTFYEQNIKWEKNITKGINEFIETTSFLDESVKIMINSCTNIFDRYKQQHLKMKALISQLSQFYDPAESPQEEMTNVLNIFDGFSRKISNIVSKLTQIHNKIIRTMMNCKNHAQIIMSLLSVKKKSNATLFQYQKEIPIKPHKSQLKQLIEQISFKYIKELVLEIYVAFQQINLQFSLSLVSSYRQSQQKPIDSMQLSHVRTTKYHVDRKKPLKQEIWLWKDWKIQMNANFQNFDQLFQEILSATKKNSSEGSQKDGTVVERYKCNLMDKDKIQGFLKLKIKCLQFQSQDKNRLISIEWKQIQNMEIRSKMFDKILVLKTMVGQIVFCCLDNYEIVLDSLKQAQEKSLSGNTKIKKKLRVTLSPQQIKQINQRKQKIKGQLPNYEGFRLIDQVTLQNQDIDSIYDIFYSDKPFNFYGKEQSCFFSYCGKKSGNYDWIAEKYDKPGPKFYSLQEGVDFTNCPLFSRRKITYNHPLPSIPFMPSFCGNIDDRKIYWTSHEQFDYLIHSQSSGIMLSDSFCVQLLHKVVQVQKNVKIQIYSKIIFLKDVALKNIVINNTDPELERNMKQFLKQLQKVLRLRKNMSVAGTEKIIFEKQDIQTQIKPQGDEMSKLKLHNKILLVVVVSLILINLISKLFF